MSSFTMTFLVCDECDQEFNTFGRLANQVREVARERGWKVNMTGGKRDICPSCQAAQSGSSGGSDV